MPPVPAVLFSAFTNVLEWDTICSVLLQVGIVLCQVHQLLGKKPFKAKLGNCGRGPSCVVDADVAVWGDDHLSRCLPEAELRPGWDAKRSWVAGELARAMWYFGGAMRAAHIP